MTDSEPCHKRKLVVLPDDAPVIKKTLRDLSGFKLVKVLAHSSMSKSITLHVKSEETHHDAVVKLDKTPFDGSQVEKLLSEDTKVTNTFKNDVYGQYSGAFPSDINAAQATIIYPATEKHISKYSEQESHLCTESPEDYKSITLPWINSMDQFSLKWVYNILEHKAESDRIVFEDPDPVNGFILLPDLKWNGTNMEELYLSVIVHRRDIKSLRDLRAEHLPLLKNILDKGSAEVERKYGVSRTKLRMYIHYQPTFYHFHAHITLLKMVQYGSLAERAHLLQDVVDNLEHVDSKYYAKRTLSFALAESSKLYQLLSKKESPKE